MEAVRFSKVLAAESADFAKANAIESEFVEGTRGWCGGLLQNGAGRGAALDSNAETAKQLANSAAVVSTQVGRVRQAVYDMPLTQEYTKQVRSNLIDELMKRQRALQEVRALLQRAAPVFIQFRDNREYAGDSYPGEIARLNEVLATYKGPPDVLAQAMTNLKGKYKIAAADLGK